MTHLCFACLTQLVPVYRCFCTRCFKHIPWVLRADVMNAYRRRVLHRHELESKLAELRDYLNGGN